MDWLSSLLCYVAILEERVRRLEVVAEDSSAPIGNGDEHEKQHDDGQTTPMANADEHPHRPRHPAPPPLPSQGSFSCVLIWRRQIYCSKSRYCSISFVFGNNCPNVD